MTENVAKIGGGSYIEAKLQDILYPKPVEKRSAEDIISGMKDKMNKLK